MKRPIREATLKSQHNGTTDTRNATALQPFPQKKTGPQKNKVTQLETALVQLLAEVSRRGYFGTAGIVVNVQDGRIQHIRVSTDRMMK